MKPCKRGHTKGRDKTGHCVVCRRMYAAAYNAAYCAAHREEKRAYDVIYHAAHREKKLAYSARYRLTPAGIKSELRQTASRRGNR